VGLPLCEIVGFLVRRGIIGLNGVGQGWEPCLHVNLLYPGLLVEPVVYENCANLLS
jgi:hypothetical protein